MSDPYQALRSDIFFESPRYRGASIHRVVQRPKVLDLLLRKGLLLVFQSRRPRPTGILLMGSPVQVDHTLSGPTGVALETRGSLQH